MNALIFMQNFKQGKDDSYFYYPRCIPVNMKKLKYNLGYNLVFFSFNISCVRACVLLPLRR